MIRIFDVSSDTIVLDLPLNGSSSLKNVFGKSRKWRTLDRSKRLVIFTRKEADRRKSFIKKKIFPKYFSSKKILRFALYPQFLMLYIINGNDLNWLFSFPFFQEKHIKQQTWYIRQAYKYHDPEETIVIKDINCLSEFLLTYGGSTRSCNTSETKAGKLSFNYNFTNKSSMNLIEWGRSGHRRPVLLFVKKFLADLDVKCTSCIFSPHPIFFLSFDDRILFGLTVAIMRNLFGRETLLLSYGWSLHNERFTRKLAGIVIFRLRNIYLIDTVSFSYQKARSGVVYLPDFQFFDIFSRSSLNNLGHPETFDVNTDEVWFIGTVSERKMVNHLRKLCRIIKQVSYSDAVVNGNIAISKDADLINVGLQNKFVWCVTSTHKNKSSGVFGHVVQAGGIPIVTKLSYLHSVVVKYQINHVTFNPHFDYFKYVRYYNDDADQRMNLALDSQSIWGHFLK